MCAKIVGGPRPNAGQSGEGNGPYYRRWGDGMGRLDRTVYTESSDVIEMPVNAIGKLHQEHANIRCILLGWQDTSDLVLLAKTLYYVREFSSIARPPTEDIIFGKLLITDAPVKQKVDRLRRQLR